MSWPQFVAKYIINEWGAKRGVPPPEFAVVVRAAYTGLLTRQQARAYIKAMRP